MSTELELTPRQYAITPDQLSLIKSTIAKEATDEELNLFLHHCKRTGLDPLAKQIYFQKRKNHKTGKSDVTIMTGIDGYRLTADRTGKYAGSDDPVFDNEDSPNKATVTVYKLVGGIRCPFTAAARWNQYYPGDAMGFMWKKMPHLMLGKCAEALALRKAFPAELSGIYVKEEMEQATPAIEVKAELPEQVYTGTTQEQRDLLKKFAIEAGAFKGIDDPDMRGKVAAEIGEAVLGKKMSDLRKEVIDFVTVPFRN